jgi:hypothetical protein
MFGVAGHEARHQVSLVAARCRAGRFDPNGLTDPARDGALLRSITTLQIINQKAVAKFWADFPAEKEVESVISNLKELNPGFDGKVTSKSTKGS